MFSRAQRGVVSLELFHRAYYINFVALERCEKECSMLEIILVQGFSLMKSKITQFPNGLFLKSYFPSKKIYLFRWTSTWDSFQTLPLGPKVLFRGAQREYSLKPLKHSIVERILVFKW